MADSVSSREALRPAKRTKPTLILTALPVEYKAVRGHLEGLEEHMGPDGVVFECGWLNALESPRYIAIAQSGVGNIRAGVVAQKAISFFNPEVVVFIGTAGGLKDVAIGDVVAATKVYGYEYGRAERSFKPRPLLHICSFGLEQCARAEVIRGEWLREAGPGPTHELPSALVAPIAVGSKVVASTDSAAFAFLRESFSDAVAVEMEALGVLEASYSSSSSEAIAICGISDLVAGKEEADAAGCQELAARNASAFAFSMLSHLHVREGLPIYPVIGFCPSSTTPLTKEEARRVREIYRMQSGVIAVHIKSVARELVELDAKFQPRRISKAWRRLTLRERHARETSYSEALSAILDQAINPRLECEMTPRNFYDAFEGFEFERETLTTEHIRKVYVSVVGMLKLPELQESFETAELGGYIADRIHGIERSRRAWELSS